MIHRTFRNEIGGGRILRGDVRIPRGTPPRSAVVLVHGFKGFKDWGFFPHLGRRLAGAGHAVVSFNFSGAGVTGPQDEVTDLEAFATNTLSREIEELGLVLALTAEGDLLPARPDAVGLMGHSRGGGGAILCAAERGGVDALVTWAAVSTFDRWSEEVRRDWRERGRVYVLNTRTGRQLPLDVALLDDFEENRERFDVARRARDVAAPWLIVHGLQDLTVDAEEARVLARAAPGAHLLLVEGAGHTFETSHPLAGAPPAQLEEAAAATVLHFGRHLAGEAR